MGRFINADEFSCTGQGLLGNNMFAYCGNNAPNNYDPSGTMRASIVQKRNLACGGSYGISIGLLVPFVWLGSIAEKVDEYKKEITEKMEASLAKYGREPSVKEEKHHISAKRALLAQEASNILRELFIDGVETSENLVMVKYNVHRCLHTSSYYSLANLLVVSAYAAANGDFNKQKENVTYAVSSLRAFIEMLNMLEGA